MLYLASPYSHVDPEVREARYVAACRATAVLLRFGFVVFSPIVHSHNLVGFGLPTDFRFWENADKEYLSRCDELVVLQLEGWLESVGVQAEIKMALEMGKPVRYLGVDA